MSSHKAQPSRDNNGANGLDKQTTLSWIDLRACCVHDVMVWAQPDCYPGVDGLSWVIHMVIAGWSRQKSRLHHLSVSSVPKVLLYYCVQKICVRKFSRTSCVYVPMRMCVSLIFIITFCDAHSEMNQQQERGGMGRTLHQFHFIPFDCVWKVFEICFARTTCFCSTAEGTHC